ncbi:hypothetical protein Thal_1008 [Thermocrinis albus DSM 14484]|uniref:Uncharacterized protein n=1 Tax=Thermocrinis albus (strain DSM 14484 / JCM 11386 / HI 11/12) TaxID=638303 RepID=D3SLL0_THEAH|nr:hypothetical protein [Thermocrinis albus]ADC89640.1 hypothetical protein Thal_1008 [Thermocrinis albus DSM 14484]
MEEQVYAVPFSLVGFFFTSKPIEESIRTDLSPEELEKLQEILSRFLFTEGVQVAIYPSVVPPDQAEEAVEELEDMIWGEEEE